MTILEQLNTHSAELLDSRADGEILWQVWQNSQFRWLQDSNNLVHSAVALTEVASATLPHINSMALAFAFVTMPLDQVFLAGLGGADQLRQIKQLAPQAKLTCVDSSAAVVALQQQYFNQGLGSVAVDIQVDDVALALGRNGRLYDLILLDVLSGSASPECLWQPSFYQQCQRRLAGDGVLAVNILPGSQRQLLSLAVSLRQLFCKRMLFIPVLGCDNVVLLLFKQSPRIKNELALQQAITALEKTLTYSLQLDVLQLHQLNVTTDSGALELWQQ